MSKLKLHSYICSASLCRCTLVSVRMCVCVCVPVLVYCSITSLDFQQVARLIIQKDDSPVARATFAPGLIVIGTPHCPPAALSAIPVRAPPPSICHPSNCSFCIDSRAVAELRSTEFSIWVVGFSFFSIFNFLFRFACFFFLFYVVIPFNVCAAHLSFLPSFHCPRQGLRQTGKDRWTDGQTGGHSERPSVVSKWLL